MAAGVVTGTPTGMRGRAVAREKKGTARKRWTRWGCMVDEGLGTCEEVM